MMCTGQFVIVHSSTVTRNAEVLDKDLAAYSRQRGVEMDARHREVLRKSENCFVFVAKRHNIGRYIVLPVSSLVQHPSNPTQLLLNYHCNYLQMDRR